MKNVVLLQPDIIHADIIFTYGKKAYKKLLKLRYNRKGKLNEGGLTTVYDSYKDLPYTVIISVNKASGYKDTLALRESLVHEISHTVTYVMKYFNFDCDEFRSYTTEWIYGQLTPQLNKILKKG